jgi:hypothetical protein
VVLGSTIEILYAELLLGECGLVYRRS